MIGTLVERQTLVVNLIHLGRADSLSLHRALVRDVTGLTPHMLRAITWDQGTEMAAHEKIAADLSVKVYFCDPSSPWQRPSNENTNGLPRDYFPKSADLAIHSRADLLGIEEELNRRPERSLVTAHQPVRDPASGRRTAQCCSGRWKPSRRIGLISERCRQSGEPTSAAVSKITVHLQLRETDPCRTTPSAHGYQPRTLRCVRRSGLFRPMPNPQR